MRVAIVGGGIGGMALALSLRDAENDQIPPDLAQALALSSG